jgi:hypothetical protein
MKMNSFRNAKASPKQYNTPTFNICNLESIFIMSKKTKPKNMTKKII